MKTVSFLYRRLGNNKALYAAAVLMVAASALMTLLTPYIIKIIIDYILGDEQGEIPRLAAGIVAFLGGVDNLRANLWICGLAVVASTLLNGITMYYRGWLSSKASEKIVKDLRDDLFSHIQKLPYDELVKVKTGDFIQRCTSDVETVRRFLSIQLVEAGRTVIMITGVIFVMFSQNRAYTLASIIMIPFIFLFSLLFFFLVRNAFQITDEAEGDMMTILQENLTGIRVVRAFGRQRFEIDKFEKASVHFRDLDLKLAKLVSYFWSISEFMCLAQLGAILIIGVIWTVNGSITLGTLLLFASYGGQLLWPIRQLGQILADMGRMSISALRLMEILEMPVEDMREDGITPNMNGDIEFKNICFEYRSGETILKDISFKVKSGQTVAIMGPVGSGKTTLINLLSALYDYTSGSLTIGGYELKDMNKEWIRKHVGVVEQEVFLYSKSVRDNIKIASRNASDDEMIGAAKIAEMHRAIEDFANGYDTVVGERGMTLSGGQKQRVAIARTIIGSYPILIFDDSLSAVDTETDAAIRCALRQRLQNSVGTDVSGGVGDGYGGNGGSGGSDGCGAGGEGDDVGREGGDANGECGDVYSGGSVGSDGCGGSGATTFIIAHRITTLFEADLILVFEEGKITSAGTHNELIERDGLYRRIWELQGELETGSAEGA